jgi:hypothetical protein
MYSYKHRTSAACRALTVFVLAIGASITPACTARADTASALILEGTGLTVPDVQPYSEVHAGSRVQLKEGAKLVFLFYPTCTRVEVIGGTVTFGARQYDVSNGSESHTKVACPQKIARRTSGSEPAGIMMRGLVDRRWKLPNRPSIALVGERADDFASLTVMNDQRLVLQAPIKGHVFKWPADAPDLPSRGSYKLILLSKTHRSKPVTIEFKTVGQSDADSPSQSLTVIQVN